MEKVKGFTLIELSIVLIIISLITAGITGGKALIKQAELQSVVKDVTTYKTAINTFKLKYDSLPGDIPNAWDYFDGSGGGTAICGADAFSNDTAASGCNGDGDGQINWTCAYPACDENRRAWQHLSLAGLIPGDYTGRGFGGTLLGVNVPASKIKGAGYDLVASGLLYGRSGLIFKYGNISANLEGKILTVSEAVSFDTKTDDGKADGGKVRAFDEARVSVDECVVNPGGGPVNFTTGPADYNKSFSGQACAFWIFIQS